MPFGQDSLHMERSPTASAQKLHTDPQLRFYALAPIIFGAEPLDQ